MRAGRWVALGLLPLAGLLIAPTLAWAEAQAGLPAGAHAGVQAGIALDPHPLSVLPFVLLLLAIALLPLTTVHFWHSHFNRLLVCAGLALPAVIYMLCHGAVIRSRLGHEMQEYVSFIVLLGSLYVISGGLLLQGDLKPSVAGNVTILLLGSLLANLIGTTGASMVLIRPYLRMNRERRFATHLVVFFIFTVSNVGGALTPLGDPPLFLGFLRGVDFWWTLSLWRPWLLCLGVVLGAFTVWDALAFRRYPLKPFPKKEQRPQPLRLRGWVNLPLLAGVVLAVLLQSEQVGRQLGRLLGPGNLTLPTFGAWGVMAALAGLSLLGTPADVRRENGFSWSPILEVAVIFLGLFASMGPAVLFLEKHGKAFGPRQPWQFFWLTGLLSSCLDNAPTYLAFGTMACSSNGLQGDAALGQLAQAAPRVLTAISCGAVFIGANTYVGNGPNFMVKALADEAGARTPSFFGYLLYSGLILLPTFVVLTLVFFR